MTNRLSSCVISASLIWLTACGSYDFTVNDKVIYTPDPLFAEFDVPDKALRACIVDAINDNKVTAANELSRLTCADAGIANLAGLSTFTEIEQLILSSNSIVDISELASLTVLQVLYLDNNRVVDAVPLYQLPALHRVDLSGNPGLLCPQSGSLLRVETVILPDHCR
jgi:hypothetical protein